MSDVINQLHNRATSQQSDQADAPFTVLRCDTFRQESYANIQRNERSSNCTLALFLCIASNIITYILFIL